MNWVRRLFYLIIATLLSSGPASAQKHVALIIDNGAEASTPAGSPPAPTPAAISERLLALHYTVIQGQKLDQQGMRQRIGEFRTAAAAADVAVFYFYGRVMEVGGRNHLISFEAGRGADIASLDLEDVTEAMKASKANVVLLDSGYFDPVTEELARAGASRHQGFAPLGDKKDNFLIALSTSPRKVIPVREDRTRFSRALLSQLRDDAGDWGKFGEGLRLQVIDESRQAQIPYVRNSLRQPVRIAGLPPPKTDALPTDEFGQTARARFVRAMHAELRRHGCLPPTASTLEADVETGLENLNEKSKTAPAPRIDIASAGKVEFDQWIAWSRRAKPVCVAAITPPPPPAPKRATPPARPPQAVSAPRPSAGPSGGSRPQPPSGGGGGGGNRSLPGAF